MCVVDSSREPAFLSSDFRDSFTSRMMLPCSTSDPRVSAQFRSTTDPQPGTSCAYQGLSDSNPFDAQWSFRHAPPHSHVGHKPVFAHQQPTTRIAHPSFHNPIGQYPHHGQGPFHHRVHHDAAVVTNADVMNIPPTTSHAPDQAGVMKKRRSSHFGPDLSRVKKAPDLDGHPRCRRERVRRGVTCRYSPRLSPSLRYEPMVADSTNSYLPPPPCPVDLSSGSDTSDCDSDIDVINPLLYPSTRVSNRPARPQPFMPLLGEEDLHNYTNSAIPTTDVNRDFEPHVLDYGNGCGGPSEMQFVEPSSSQHIDAVVSGDVSATPHRHVVFDRNDDTDSDVEVVSVVTRSVLTFNITS